MAIVPLFPDRIVDELSVVARHAAGGAILITPAGDISLARGEVTPDAAHLARMNACRATASIDEMVCSVCDDGSRVHLVAITDGWVLAVQTRVGIEVRAMSAEAMRASGLKLLLRHARDCLALWLAYTHLPHPGGRDSGQSGAPAEVFAERPPKRRN